MRGVFYSVCGLPDYRQIPRHLAQLRLSIESLRNVNARLPVYVFTFGTPAAVIAGILKRDDICIIEKPDYSSALERYCGERSSALAHYPTLHRWLVLEHFLTLPVEGLLYVDTDTFFLSDPAVLFEQYQACDFYTREEPCTSLSHLGYDPQYLDEDAMKLLARRLTIQLQPMMNIGVVLMNNRIWEQIPLVLGHFFSYLWRFVVWMALHPDPAITSERRMQPLLKHAAALAGPTDRDQALPFFSSNGWIVDEISILFALAHLERFNLEIFNRQQVLQGPEFSYLNPSSPDAPSPVLCHYYSRNYESFQQWWNSQWKLQPFRAGNRIG